MNLNGKWDLTVYSLDWDTFMLYGSFSLFWQRPKSTMPLFRVFSPPPHLPPPTSPSSSSSSSPCSQFSPSLSLTHLSFLSTFAVTLELLFSWNRNLFIILSVFPVFYLLSCLISCVSSQTLGSGRSALFFLLPLPTPLFLHPPPPFCPLKSLLLWSSCLLLFISLHCCHPHSHFSLFVKDFDNWLTISSTL